MTLIKYHPEQIIPDRRQRANRIASNHLEIDTQKINFKQQGEIST